eukprot:Lithocolla_globosa_v1_NODE_626_length_3567_cov_17.757403.p3 type:complete len:129 gc:universal NODE_626_length_3567_cov_17.757403:1894-1508(-)
MSGDYEKWSQGKKTPMKPAKADRFGRLAENSFSFLHSHDKLVQFLSSVGGETNLLTQAVEQYLNTPWMKVSAGVVVYISQLSELPLLKALNLSEADLIDFSVIFEKERAPLPKTQTCAPTKSNPQRTA